MRTQASLLHAPMERARKTFDSAMRRAREVAFLASRQAVDAAFRPGWRLWHGALSSDVAPPPEEELPVLQARRRTLHLTDRENATRGIYPAALLDFPWWTHSASAPGLLADLPAVWWRRRRNEFRELPAGEPLERYPAYYRRTFRWQTDGWMSAQSAERYELGVEFFFRGAADVIRRMTLPPLVERARKQHRPKILDIGCGTGAFLGQLRAAVPHASLTGLDMSPHYIGRAHRKMAGLGDVSLVVENAEAMPFAEAAFDHALAVFLFHELPRDARRNVAAEAFRVLSPGGRLVVCDSAQLTDEEAAAFKGYLHWFPARYHEPYFRSYLRDDLAELLTGCGFEVERVELHDVSKVVVARKPPRPAQRRGPVAQRD